MRLLVAARLAVLALVVSLAAAQNEVPYQSESGSWSFVKPNSWNPIGFAVMRQVETENRADYPDKNSSMWRGSPAVG